MTEDAIGYRPTTLRDYITTLRRRWRLIVALPAIAATVAYLISAQQAPLYEAHAQVLIVRSAGVSTQVTGTDPTLYDSERYLSTQAKIARSVQLADRVAGSAGVRGLTPGGVLRMSKVSANPTADVLDFAVKSGDETAAIAIANAYAEEFTLYKAELDTARIVDALRVLRARMAELRESSGTSSATYETLFQYESQLLTAQKLVADNTSVLERAYAFQLSPHPRRNLILGGLLGLVLALGLAFLAEALDRRVRTEAELEAVLGIPLLGRVPAPPDALRRASELVMVAEPLSPHAEVFRRLRTNMDFVNRERRARSVMFTSAVPHEGKSTTVANIAVAMARAGRHVVLVDLDVRRPRLHTFFGIQDDRGIADVVIGDRPLDEVLRPIVLPARGSAAPSKSNGRPGSSGRPRWSPSGRPVAAVPAGAASDGRADTESVLHLLPSGWIPTSYAEFLENERVLAVLDELRETFETVLVDGPPLLAVGDAMTLSSKVDAMVVVTHLGIQRPVLDELARQLENCPAARLGFILTGVPESDGYGYGYGYRDIARAEELAEAAEQDPERV